MSTREVPRLDVDALIDDPATKVVVCCGSGGVGKTTTAAALAVRAADRGRRTVVLTIDPAKRLAEALGLTTLSNEPKPVTGVTGADLHAMMLDMRRTFDDMVYAHATADRADQIISNPFYQSISSSFSGTQEYMAMEKLGQLRSRDMWDLIVVDTPPSRSGAATTRNAVSRSCRIRYVSSARCRNPPNIESSAATKPDRSASS